MLQPAAEDLGLGALPGGHSRQKLFRDWPTPISGYEVGASIRFPASSIANDFVWVPDHPVADAYRNYMKMPYDRPTWDLTAALYAVRPERGYFLSISAGYGGGGFARRYAFHSGGERPASLPDGERRATQPRAGSHDPAGQPADDGRELGRQPSTPELP